MFVLKRLSGDPPQKRPISQPTLPTSFDSRAIRSVLLQKRQFEKGRAFKQPGSRMRVFRSSIQ